MNYDEIQEILQKVEAQKLHDFVTFALQKFPSLQTDFKNEFYEYFPQQSKEDYKREIYHAFDLAGGSDGYIDYDETDNYTGAMYGFTNQASKLIENKNYMSALDILETILISMTTTDIDDSDGCRWDVADDCMANIKNIISQAILENEEKVYQRIFTFLMHEAITGEIANYGIETSDLFNEFIDNQMYLREMQKEFPKIIAKSDKYKAKIYQELLQKIEEN